MRVTGDSAAMRFDAQLLAASLSEIPAAAWSLASTYPDTGVHHGYRRVVLVSAGRRQRYAELFDDVWRALHPVRDAWLSRIEPGGFIVPHRDPAPWFERWQVPIAAAGQWHYGADDSAADPGVAFPVRHWEPHAVTNRTAAPRIHIVVDRDIRIDRDPLPFHIFPPAGMADLIERTTQ